MIRKVLVSAALTGAMLTGIASYSIINAQENKVAAAKFNADGAVSHPAKTGANGSLSARPSHPTP